MKVSKNTLKILFLLLSIQSPKIETITLPGYKVMLEDGEYVLIPKKMKKIKSWKQVKHPARTKPENIYIYPAIADEHIKNNKVQFCNKKIKNLVVKNN